MSRNCTYIQTNFKEEIYHMSELLTVSEVADILRVDDTTVRRWVKQGALEAVILPHVNERQAYRIKRETLDRVLGDAANQLGAE
ncbi:helix-turn-helix domain-containing protein [Dictyobacter kobayashii]